MTEEKVITALVFVEKEKKELFKIIVSMEELGDFPFEEAFRKFFEKIKEKSENCGNIKILKATSFIEYNVETPKGIISCTMSFYQVLDFAYEIGLLKNEELQNSISMPPELLAIRIKTAFLEAEHEINNYEKELKEKIATIEKELAKNRE